MLRLGLRETFRRLRDVPPLMPGEVAYRIACCEAAAATVRRLSRRSGGARPGYRDLARVRSEEYWKEWHVDQRIRDMIGIIDTGSMSRDEGWRYDLAFLAREIKRLAYAPFALISRRRSSTGLSPS